jgi:hypothetical protein
VSRSWKSRAATMFGAALAVSVVSLVPSGGLAASTNVACGKIATVQLTREVADVASIATAEQAPDEATNSLSAIVARLGGQAVFEDVVADGAQLSTRRSVNRRSIVKAIDHCVGFSVPIPATSDRAPSAGCEVALDFKDCVASQPTVDEGSATGMVDPLGPSVNAGPQGLRGSRLDVSATPLGSGKAG